MLAAALGLDAEGGSVGAQHRTRRTEPGSLHLVVERSPGADRWAYVLRDETLHGFYSYLEENRTPSEPLVHEPSHGEAFLRLFGRRPSPRGLCLLDEPPPTPPSSPHCLARGCWRWGPGGLRPTSWEQLDLVEHWRQFLADPGSYPRHLG